MSDAYKYRYNTNMYILYTCEGGASERGSAQQSCQGVAHIDQGYR